ncbi:cystathionine gamma-lyase [Rhodococcus erythropolis]|uniref:cystathionine gamma-lyase n=1 Tax=Rhodococcus erythropolis TaxID=1833 RepID=UPI000878EAFD|nr:cystathionine gamma-lyase [Rhodococcus erythropolis]OFV73295.1 methionine gamma-lyase [Rhodococcus erythropolis]
MSEIGVSDFEGYGDSTRSVSAVAREHAVGQPMQMGPIFAAPYQLSVDEGSESDTYARASNPGWRGLESALAALEGADHALVMGSGMSAITATLRSVLVAGDTVVVPSDGYYQVRLYANERLAPLGITVREVSTLQMGDASFADLLDASPGRVVVVAETPSNPVLDVVDLRVLADVCHRSGALLIVDNTTATPLGQRPLELGADVVVASGTKALSGHSDLLMGYVATCDAAVSQLIERERLLSGTVLGPFETWLAHRSLGTAGLRFGRQCDNALALAEMLAGHKAVRSVRYPGLRGDPSYTTASGQMKRFGGLVSVELGSAQAFHSFVEASNLVTAATSFGGIHTTADRRARWGDPVSAGFVRIACGIEDTADLLADIERALDA